MNPRINYNLHTPDLIKKLFDLSQANSKGALDKTILDLVHIRASQMNGCAFCLDMHVKEAKIHGERELRLHHVSIWRESPLFSARERAALTWTEVLTRLPEHGVSNEVYDQVRAHFSEKELTDLTFLVMGINAWNRVNVAFQTVPGSADKAYGLDKANLT